MHRAVRSTATVRNANRIGRRMAGGRANVNGFLLGRNNGEGQEVKDAIEVHLRHAATKVSKSRIKRLRGLSQPQYRLRVADVRVFYDVTETEVEILAIVHKDEAQAWLDEEGTPTESGGAR